MKKGLAVDVIQRDAVCVYIIMGVWVGVDGWRSFVVVIHQIYIYIYILEGVCIYIYMRITRVT